jgi:hypothetical protein
LSLKTDYKDAILASGAGTLRKYQQINNADGTVSFQDVTEYSQVGDKAKASVFNETNGEINAHEARIDNPHGVTAAQSGALPNTTTHLPNPSALTAAQGYGGQTGSYDGSTPVTISVPKITLHTSDPGTVSDGELWAVY